MVDSSYFLINFKLTHCCNTLYYIFVKLHQVQKIKQSTVHVVCTLKVSTIRYRLIITGKYSQKYQNLFFLYKIRIDAVYYKLYFRHPSPRSTAPVPRVREGGGRPSRPPRHQRRRPQRDRSQGRREK